MKTYYLKSEIAATRLHVIEADCLEDAIDAIETGADTGRELGVTGPTVTQWQIDGRMGWYPATEGE